MTLSLWLLIIAVVLGGAILLVHIAMLFNVIRSELSLSWKLLSLVPLVTPVASWRSGNEPLASLWGLLVIGYIAVRIIAAA